MTEFTKHEQQQIRDGLKTSHRVLIDPQPPSKPFQLFGERSGDYFVENRTKSHHLVGQWRGRPPHKPGDRIPCDNGDVIVGDVWAQRVGEMTDIDAIAEGFPGVNCYMVQGFSKLCSHDGELPIEQFADHWNERNPSNPFGSNPWVWVLTLSWEASE